MGNSSLCTIVCLTWFTTTIWCHPRISDGLTTSLTSSNPLICGQHWLASSSSHFQSHKEGVERILTSSPPSVSALINRDLSLTYEKVSSLASFARGQSMTSASQELWARAIIAFYLSQARSSVLNHIGSLPIGIQVSLVDKCVETVDAISNRMKTYVRFCATNERMTLSNRGDVTSDMCLLLPQSTRPPTISSRALPLTQPKLTIPTKIIIEIPALCDQVIWDPLWVAGGKAMETVVALFQKHPDPRVNKDLVDGLNENVRQQQKLKDDIRRGDFEAIGAPTSSVAELLHWKDEKMTMLDKESGDLVDAFFGILGTDVKAKLGEICVQINALVQQLTIAEAKCLRIPPPSGPVNGGNNVCWLSNKAIQQASGSAVVH